MPSNPETGFKDCHGALAVTVAAKNTFFWGFQEKLWYAQVQKSVVNFVFAERNTIQIESADRPNLGFLPQFS